MLEFLNSNYLDVQEVVHHSENLSIQYQEQKFCIKLAFSEEHEKAKNVKKKKRFNLSVFNKNVNFSTEFHSVLNQLKANSFLLAFPHLTLF